MAANVHVSIGNSDVVTVNAGDEDPRAFSILDVAEGDTIAVSGAAEETPRIVRVTSAARSEDGRSVTIHAEPLP